MDPSKNAFGSVLHDTMWLMMERLKVPADFLSICSDIYHNTVHTIRSTAGSTPLIPLNQGIKQGCPLSPVLFNIVLERVIPKLTTFYRFQRVPRPAALRLPMICS